MDFNWRGKLRKCLGHLNSSCIFLPLEVFVVLFYSYSANIVFLYTLYERKFCQVELDNNLSNQCSVVLLNTLKTFKMFPFIHSITFFFLPLNEKRHCSSLICHEIINTFLKTFGSEHLINSVNLYYYIRFLSNYC